MTALEKIPVSGHSGLRARFEERRDDVVRSLATLQEIDCLDEGRYESIVRSLHMLAGVAALFGAPRLGELAAHAENVLRGAPPERRPDLIATLRTAIDREARS